MLIGRIHLYKEVKGVSKTYDKLIKCVVASIMAMDNVNPAVAKQTYDMDQLVSSQLDWAKINDPEELKKYKKYAEEYLLRRWASLEIHIIKSDTPISPDPDIMYKSSAGWLILYSPSNKSLMTSRISLDLGDSTGPLIITVREMVQFLELQRVTKIDFKKENLEAGKCAAWLKALELNIEVLYQPTEEKLQALECTFKDYPEILERLKVYRTRVYKRNRVMA